MWSDTVYHFQASFQIKLLDSMLIDVQNFAVQFSCPPLLFMYLFIIKGGCLPWAVTCPVVAETIIILLLKNYKIIKYNVATCRRNTILAPNELRKSSLTTSRFKWHCISCLALRAWHWLAPFPQTTQSCALPPDGETWAFSCPVHLVTAVNRENTHRMPKNYQQPSPVAQCTRKLGAEGKRRWNVAFTGGVCS